MSYNSGAPKTTYGDELQDDTWSPGVQTSPSSSNYPQQTNYTKPYQRMNPMPNQYSQSSMMPPTRVIANPNQTPLTQPGELMNIAMTPEDLMFMKQVRSELIMTRIFPISAAAFSALYYYNRQKQLPQIVSRYILVGFGSVFVSMFTYRGRFRRKVAESTLTTPYIETMRRNMGIPSKSDNFGAANELNQISDYGNPDRWAAASNLAPFETQTTPNQQPLEPNQSFDSGFEKMDDAKPLLSYEELRARNRGYSRSN